MPRPRSGCRAPAAVAMETHGPGRAPARGQRTLAAVRTFPAGREARAACGGFRPGQAERTTPLPVRRGRRKRWVRPRTA